MESKEGTKEGRRTHRAEVKGEAPCFHQYAALNASAGKQHRIQVIFSLLKSFWSVMYVYSVQSDFI